MGRITVFTASGCRHCTRIKSILDNYNLPYVEISVTRHPQKRDDMMALSDKVSTPQVFFNTRHVGGANETIELLQKWESECVATNKNNNRRRGSTSRSNSKCRYYATPLERYQAEIEAYPDPGNPKFDVPEDKGAAATSKDATAGSIGGKEDVVMIDCDCDDENDDACCYLGTPAANKATTAWQGADDAGCDDAGDDDWLKIALPGLNKKVTVLNVTETLKRVLPRRDIQSGSTVYTKCFTSTELIYALQNQYYHNKDNNNDGLDNNDKESNHAAHAVELAMQLQSKYKIIHRVVSMKDKKFSKGGDEVVIFRLQCDRTPKILNSYCIWPKTKPSNTTTDPFQLVNRLMDLMESIESELTDERGILDYGKLSTCETYPVFEEAVCELQVVDLLMMAAAKKKNRGSDEDFHHNTIMSFGINVYNIMIKYAFMKVGVVPMGGGAAKSRSAFYNRIKFEIGGQLYSFDEWEHGILRGNKRAPYGLSLPISTNKNDPRLALSIDRYRVDYRIHFTLNCGAKSCPPVNRYTADNLEEELRVVAQSFCEDDDHVSINVEKNEVQLSKLMDWYRSDFTDAISRDGSISGSGNTALLHLITTHLRGIKKQNLEQLLRKKKSSKVKVVYKQYDWSTPSKNNLKFDPNHLKANRKVGVFGRRSSGLQQLSTATTSSPSSTTKNNTNASSTKMAFNAAAAAAANANTSSCNATAEAVSEDDFCAYDGSNSSTSNSLLSPTTATATTTPADNKSEEGEEEEEEELMPTNLSSTQILL